ncbi:hypothetical protein Poli38472_008121 [Pythium oligandrum]|uniref:NADP-dependent oxidoreductase domain-containing protein n=1 Tax=Pythium oligandrum TaxID=41045 RepID=A0A8K1CLX9_PYTOL|nr:hypothetical protein Poli38472_008121 [Pythium oligandrum]|eukprot:TMW65479.1 hypothetical protein Poli38472_008121 [Pythium oligandrum]
MATIATKQLGSGAVIPVIGLGTWQCRAGEHAYIAVLNALKLGYRHIDTAQMYGNERDVGRAITESGLSRGEVFVTSKYYTASWDYDQVVSAVKQSVERIGGGYVDLYLLHTAGNASKRADAWRALEDMQDEGLVRDIGVSNFTEAHLKKLSETWRVKPAVNQIELHPWLTRTELVAFCEGEGIHLEAYSPLAQASKWSDRVVRSVAKEVDATPAQVLIAWSVAKGFIPIPKSADRTRQKENLEAYNIQLSEGQIQRLDALEEDFVTGWRI